MAKTIRVRMCFKCARCQATQFLERAEVCFGYCNNCQALLEPEIVEKFKEGYDPDDHIRRNS